MYEILAESRAVKLDQEVDLIRWAVKATTEAHVECFKKRGIGFENLVTLFLLVHVRVAVNGRKMV